MFDEEKIVFILDMKKLYGILLFICGRDCLSLLASEIHIYFARIHFSKTPHFIN
jgi:hypothetical protein